MLARITVNPVFAMLSNSRLLALALMLMVPCWPNPSRAQSLTSPPGVRQKDFKSDATRGKQTFSAACAGCHGLDGKGGRAPNIVDRPNAQPLADSQIFRIIENGIPGTGMPAFHSLKSSQITAVIAYLHSLRGASQTHVAPGDPGRGKAIFLGKGGCSRCHMVAGEGGFAASNLSGYARSHEVDKIRSAIISPISSSKLVTATVRGGDKYVGRVSNEDNFSLQLQTLDGAFHFLSKSDIEGVESNSEGLMPADYSSTLTTSELNDLISYLMSVAATDKPENGNKYDEWRD
jgi:cytochrome c oxidase cbb3-type subunit III